MKNIHIEKKTYRKQCAKKKKNYKYYLIVKLLFSFGSNYITNSKQNLCEVKQKKILYNIRRMHK